MNYEQKLRGWLLLAFIFLPSSFNLAFGQAGLNATVYPGYSFSTGERLTTDKLNLLGRPTIYISGTLGGTNVGLAAGSVTGVQLADTVINTNRFQWDTSSPRGIDLRTNVLTSAYLAPASVTSNQLAVAAVANTNVQNGSLSSNKLAAGFTFGLTNLPPGLTNKLLWADTNGVWSSLSFGSGFTVSNYTLIQTNSASATLAFTNPFPYLTPIPWTNNHGLGRQPGDARVVFQCLSNIGVWVTGDEVDAENATTGAVFKFGSLSVNATNTIVRLYNHSGMSVVAGDATISGLTTNYWRIKVYVSP